MTKANNQESLSSQQKAAADGGTATTSPKGYDALPPKVAEVEKMKAAIEARKNAFGR